MFPILHTTADIRVHVAQWRANGERIAFVPTMGALHDGHLALVRFAKTLVDRVVVSIFVNPTQFGQGEDFEDYPRTLDTDCAALNTVGVDAVFAPTANEMYPNGNATSIEVGGAALGLEADFRPHFFSGVATVVAKLLIAVAPDCAIFGEKDYQQLIVVQRMVSDLLLPVEIIGCPTLRADDGLALSSRNVYLTQDERRLAPSIYSGLQSCAASLRAGVKPDDAIHQTIEELKASGFDVDYVTLANAITLQTVIDVTNEPLRLLAAAKLGKTRLIDNIAV